MKEQLQLIVDWLKARAGADGVCGIAINDKGDIYLSSRLVGEKGKRFLTIEEFVEYIK